VVTVDDDADCRRRCNAEGDKVTDDEDETCDVLSDGVQQISVLSLPRGRSRRAGRPGGGKTRRIDIPGPCAACGVGLCLRCEIPASEGCCPRGDEHGRESREPQKATEMRVRARQDGGVNERAEVYDCLRYAP
jgi:hypothetical protein